MEYDVEREAEQRQWHIREKGQVSRGTTVTDAWLQQMGFGTLSRLNIDEVIRAATAGYAGQVLDPAAARQIPKEVSRNPIIRSYRPRPRIPERMLFRP